VVKSVASQAAPSAAALLARARELHPIIAAEGPRSEEAGRLTGETVAAMRGGADLFSLLIPECFGGAEASTTDALRVIEAVSYADGSTGWVLMAAQCCTGMAAAYLGRDGAAEVFGKGIPIICGQGAANGKAVVDGNGYRLTGHWSYGSGVLHSDYTHSGAIVYENCEPRPSPDGHGPEILTFIVPTREAEMKGNWDVMGLRATGSVDYAMTDVFVPAEFTHPPHASDPVQGGNTFSIGIIGMTALGHTGWIMGVGRRALDEVAAQARQHRPGRGHLPGLADSMTFHEAYGRAEARYRASRALIYETWGDIQANLDAGGKMTTRQTTLMRLALNHATSEIAEVVAWCYKTGGGTALRASALQRCFRDTYSGTQHFLTTDVFLRESGRELAGLAPGEHWTLLSLAK
jgi:alkylation response protein AidB-like acyl-CoA dehydrogenase